jgi:hypothetical protein
VIVEDSFEVVSPARPEQFAPAIRVCSRFPPEAEDGQDDENVEKSQGEKHLAAVLG